MLLQEIRARQAMKEADVNHLPLKVVHSSDPITIVGDREFKLLFPRFLFDYANDDKENNIIFLGKITPSRSEFLQGFDAFILNSYRGRDESTKVLDEFYFYSMGNSKFAICPDGDFVWTYRFFEAVMVKAIPIIENECDLYKGFKYYRKGDYYEYRQDWIEHNINQLQEFLW